MCTVDIYVCEHMRGHTGRECEKGFNSLIGKEIALLYFIRFSVL